MRVFINIRSTADLLAGEHLAHRRGGELAETAVLDVEAPDIGIEGEHFLVGEEAAATVLAVVQDDAVLLVVRREEPYGHAVLQGEGLGAVDAVLDLAGLAALEGCRVEEGFRKLLGGGLLDLGVLDGVDHGLDLLHGRVDEAFLLRSLVEDHHVLAGDELLRGLVDGIGIQHRHELLDELVLGLRIHEALVVEEVVDARHHELGIVAGVGLLGLGLELGEHFGLGALDLGLGQAEAAELLGLEQGGGQGAQRLAVLAGGLDVGDVSGLADVADTEATGQERSVRLGGDLLEALVHRDGHDVLEQVGEQAHRGAVERLRGGLAAPVDFDAGVAVLGVGEDADGWLLVVRDGDDVLLLRILGSRDVGEGTLDAGLHVVDVDVAHDDQCLHIRTVPGVVEVRQALGLEGLEVLLGADDGRGGVLGVTIEIRIRLLAHAPLGGVAGTLLLQDDAALLVDLLRVAGHEVGVVVHDEDAGVDDGRTHQGNVVEQVDGLLNARGGVHVAAEGSANALQPVEDALAGEVLGAIEAHVLQEVGEAVLVGQLLQGADVGRQVELGPLGGLLVVTDVVSQSVVKLADAGGRIVGKLLQLLRVSQNSSAEERCCKDENFFHHFHLIALSECKANQKLLKNNKNLLKIQKFLFFAR